MLIVPFLIACSGETPPVEPEPAPVAKPEPQRAEVPKPGPSRIRVPLEGPKPRQVEIDLESADPMEIVAKKGPGGTPAPAVSLIFASRGDGEIEPCG